MCSFILFIKEQVRFLAEGNPFANNFKVLIVKVIPRAVSVDEGYVMSLVNRAMVHSQREQRVVCFS